METMRGMLVYYYFLVSFALPHSSNSQGIRNRLSEGGSPARTATAKPTPLSKQTSHAVILPLIFGGNSAEGKYPFAVFIELDNGNDMCGGTLLSEDWVLTAAHCFDRTTPNKILVGASKNDGTDPNAVTRTMERKCCHKEYNPRTLEHDICLMKLSSSVRYGTFIQKAQLPPANSRASDGTMCTIMGWGYSFGQRLLAELQEAEVPVVNKNQCKSWYAEENRFIPEHHFCAGHEGGGADSCSGDSGGPLAFKENDVWIVRGITSFGPTKCGIARRPGVYTRVSHYVSWIRRTMGRPCGGHTWGSWKTICSVTCGTGVETKTRECQDGDGQPVLPSNCQGSAQETGTCTRPICKEYKWGPWKVTCSVTCGVGVKTHTRDCLDELNKPSPFGLCGSDPSVKTTKCSLAACTTYSWESWSTSCSVTCGTGIQSRRRKCVDQKGNSAPNSRCRPGNAIERGQCILPQCKVYAWGSWTTSCSVTCGIGTQTKIRKCRDQTRKIASNSLCFPGKATEQEQCRLPQCKRNNLQGLRWGPWKTWSSCRPRTTSANPCNGFQSTTRDCKSGGRDIAPHRCIATVGEDFYKERPCRPSWC